jgi:hypothetical protein
MVYAEKLFDAYSGYLLCERDVSLFPTAVVDRIVRFLLLGPRA